MFHPQELTKSFLFDSKLRGAFSVFNEINNYRPNILMFYKILILIPPEIIIFSAFLLLLTIRVSLTWKKSFGKF